MSQLDSATARVAPLARAHLPEAVGVLARAFAADPMLRWIMSASPAPMERGAQALFRFSCEVRLQLDWPLFGSFAGERLEAVAGVTALEDVPWPDSLRAVYDDLAAVIGPEATVRLERYSAHADQYRPRGPHVHLGVLGVDPAAQRLGHGRALLEAVEAWSDAQPASIGVWLDTENPSSRAFYERCGYRCVGATSVDDMRIWCMFRPRGGWSMV